MDDLFANGNVVSEEDRQALVNKVMEMNLEVVYNWLLIRGFSVNPILCGHTELAYLFVDRIRHTRRQKEDMLREVRFQNQNSIFAINLFFFLFQKDAKKRNEQL